MKPLLPFAFSIFCLLSIQCKDTGTSVAIPDPERPPYTKDSLALAPDARFDKMLGALVGSAIGDAMGASTEMWGRNEIRQKYGYIAGLTPAVRNQSPEGTWEHNLPPGATTDDTRWKYLMVKYYSRHPKRQSPEHFAKFITDYYQELAADLADKEILRQPDALDAKVEKVDWIREWAQVALAYQRSPGEYLTALNRFYGGEMSCAGMLYSPVFGLLAPTAEAAYHHAYTHAIFDIGYARDISALVASLTHMAMRTRDMDSIINAAIFVDPHRYQDSRLVGRISHTIAENARKGVWEISAYDPSDTLAQDTFGYEMPAAYPGEFREWMEQELLYAGLERDEKAIPFHAGEIWQILITALEFGGGEFEKTLQFIVNYGRDNDTVAAIAGMILGARVGFSGLPAPLKTEVVRVNRELLGLDLEAMARELAGPTDQTGKVN